MFGNGFVNPYMYQPFTGGAASMASGASTMASSAGRTGLLSKFSWGGLLSGASKTLNVVNQAIPIFYQVRPMFNNAKTMLRIMGAVKDDGSSKKTVSNQQPRQQTQTIQNYSYNQPVNQQNFSTRQSGTIINRNENPTFFI